MRKASAIVCLSGGMDSTVVLNEAIKENGPGRVLAVGFAYGSKHNRLEIEAANAICEYYSVNYWTFNVRDVFSSFHSALLDPNQKVPEGHYEEETMRQTVVPFRNGIFLSIAAGMAVSVEAKDVWLGIHAGDHFIYPDCRPLFFDRMRQAIYVGTGEEVNLRAPFLDKKKEEIVAKGHEEGIPFHLTRTCYTDNPVACGKCGSCQERLEAFSLNGLTDPLAYESRQLTSKK